MNARARSIAAHHLPHTGTILNLTTVEDASSSASGGSGGAKMKANLYRWKRCCKVARHGRTLGNALLRWLTGSVTLVRGFRLDGNVPVGTVAASSIFRSSLLVN